MLLGIPHLVNSAAAIGAMDTALAAVTGTDGDKYMPTFAESDAAANITGINSVDGTIVSAADNVINAGAGDDVIVLSTKGDDILDAAFGNNIATTQLNASNETIVYDAAFGNDTIVNFTADTDTDANEASSGFDILDFTAFLTSTVPTSLNAALINTDSNIYYCCFTKYR